MKFALARAALAAIALALACGASAADKKGDDNKVSWGDRNFIAKAMKDGATESSSAGLQPGTRKART